jgi:MoxR-like ATPase
VEVLFAQAHHHPLEDVRPVLDGAGVLALQAAVREVRVERSLGRYMIALAEATRAHKALRLGCSPRGALILFRMAQARAFLEERDYVIPEDVRAVAVQTLAHRLGLDTKARYSGVLREDVVREILDKVPVEV